MYPAHSARWRWHVKAALASTIARAHDYGFAAALARGRKRPLVLGYHRVVDDFASVSRTEMPSMLTSAAMFRMPSEKLRSLGIRDFLIKPWNRAQLFSIIRQALVNKSKETQ